MNCKDPLTTPKDKAINDKHLRRNRHVSAVSVVSDKKAIANIPSPKYDSFKILYTSKIQEINNVHLGVSKKP